jgi:IS30 family transposase
MTKNYHHLNEKDRIFLRVMLERRYPKNMIAEILGVHRSTIYREIKLKQF